VKILTIRSSAQLYSCRRKVESYTAVVLAALLVVTVSAQSPSTLRGGWSATVGPNQVLQGTWTADLTSAAPDTARGSWTLVNQSNRIAAQGTWSAVKTEKVWSGTWQARVATERGATGRLFSGSWKTRIAGSDGQSLSDLLQKTFREQVSGQWASGRLAGMWSLRSYE
jgi:hypothetical protein